MDGQFTPIGSSNRERATLIRGTATRQLIASGAACSLALAVSLVGASAIAHGDTYAKIVEISNRIANVDDPAPLLMRRGKYHAEHGDLERAYADFSRAIEIQPELWRAHLERGKVLFRQQRLAEASVDVRHFVQHQPSMPEPHGLLATILHRAGESDAALQQLEAGIAVARGGTLTELYVQRADILVATGQQRAALKSLDEAIGVRGPLLRLMSRAFEVETALSEHQAALARIDVLVRRANRKEGWLLKKARVLAGAGSIAQARTTYGEVLERIDALPASRRGVPAVSQLRQQALAELSQLHTSTKGTAP